MKPHLLYIALWYPPSRASGVYRALATSKAFLSAGWEVTVITANKGFLTDEIGSVDQSMIGQIPSEAEVVRVPFTFDMAYSAEIRKLGRVRANFPTIWPSLSRRTAPLRRAAVVLAGGPRSHPIDDKYTAWIDPVVKAALKVHTRNPFTHLLSTGNPYSAFEAARLLSNLTGVSYSVDYRDPWTIDLFTGDGTGSRQTEEAEAKIQREATLSFHVNEAIADAYRTKYPEQADKQRVVYNGYDRESIPGPSGPSRGALTFGILGTLNDRWPTKPLFKAWSEVRDDLPDGSQLVLGGHLGYFEHSKTLLEAYLPSEAMGFRYVGPVPKADVASFYESTDVVIIPVPGGPLVTSGKVFEVLALGKPVVCVQNPDGAARQLLAGHPLAFGASPDAAEVKTALLRAAAAATNLTVELSKTMQQNAAQYQRESALEQLVRAVAASEGSVRS